eukprot:scaffold14488_cov131-Isochrysis_galbana.AAC.5
MVRVHASNTRGQPDFSARGRTSTRRQALHTESRGGAKRPGQPLETRRPICARTRACRRAQEGKRGFTSGEQERNNVSDSTGAVD